MMYLKLLRKDDLAFLLRTSLQIFFGQESSFASCVSDDDATLLGGLHIALEVATDTISYRYKAELGLIKHVAMLGRELEQALSETVVVLLLLNSIV
jgi:hypothetical protein